MWLFRYHMICYAVLLSFSLSVSLSCHTYLPTSSPKMAETCSFRKLVSPTHKAVQCHIPNVKNLVHNSCSFVSKNFKFFSLPFLLLPFSLFLPLFSFFSVSLSPSPYIYIYISQFNTVLSAVIHRN